MSGTPYFGGSSAKDGKVRPLQATTFKELVERYVNIPVQLPFTRKDFNSWDVDTRDKRKDGAFICAATYDYENEGPRNDHAATFTRLVVLDLDEGDFVKDFFESPEAIAAHLHPLNFAAWTTAKHRASAPRLKIMVDVEASHPGLHRRMVNHVCNLLGLPERFKGRRESSVLSQPQYRPVAFKGEAFGAVLGSRTDGVALTEADLPPETEDETVLDDRTFACDGPEDLDAMGLSFLPVAGLTVEDIREPLLALDPDVEYKVWIEVASALRHQFTDEDDARQAYELFDEWSSAGSKYKGEDDTYCKWKSFRPYAKGRAPVTIRTLFHYATKLGGWENTKLASKVKTSFLEWLEQCEDGDELMGEGAKRIAAMPFRNEVVEEALIVAWRSRLKKVTGSSLNVIALKKEVNKTRKRENAEKEALKGENNCPSWLRPVSYIGTENVFYNFGTGVRLSPVAFDNMFSAELMPKDGGEIPANGKPVMAPSAFALNIQKIPRVDETIYYPLHQGEDPFFEHNGRLYLNIYNKYSAPIPDSDHGGRAMDLLNQLLGAMIEEEDLIKLFIDYHAYMVQNPGKKVRWSFLIQSAEGAGKGFFSKVMRGVLGGPNVKVVSPEVLSSQWNDWAKDALYIVLEEIHIPGERREKVTNAIKQVITDDVITINKRHVSAQCDVPNFATLIGFTNYKDALHLKDSSRRWCVIFSKLQTKKQVEALTATGHFEDLEWLLSPEGAAGLRYALMTWNISGGFPINGPAPHTAYRDAVVHSSRSRLEIAIEDAIARKADIHINERYIFEPSMHSLMALKTGDTSYVGTTLNMLGYNRVGYVDLNGVRGGLWATAEFPTGRDPQTVVNEIAEVEDFEV